jgi:hypothetical protein
MRDEAPQRGGRSDVGWSLAVLAGVILLIILSWGVGGNGRGWGESNRMAHMAPPMPGISDNGPATRKWSPINR